MEGLKTVTYPNGFELRYIDDPGLRNIKLRLAVDAGVGHEMPHEYGAAHFIEHVVASGGSENFSVEDSARIMTNCNMNAFTGFDATHYTASVVPEDLELALVYMWGMTENPRFDPAVVERERDAVLGEIRERRNEPDMVLFDEFFHIVYDSDPWRRLGNISVLGPEDHVRNYSPDDLRRTFSRLTKKKNTTLYLMGPIGKCHDDIEESVSELFGTESGGEPPKILTPPNSGLESVRRRTFSRAGATGTKVAMGWPVELGEENIEVYMNNLASLMKGDYTNGLFRELRAERGLLYSIFVDFVCFKPAFDAGIFYLDFTTAPGREKEAEEVILDHVGRYQRAEIAPGLSERFRKGNMHSVGDVMDNSGRRFDFLPKEKRYGMSLEELSALMESLGEEEIELAAKKLDTEKYALAAEVPE